MRKLSRRALFAALAAGAAATARAEDAAKIAQAEVQYQPMPKGMFSCAQCTLFVKPNACKVVAGSISPSGWCKLFDMAD
ncbi:MAG: iron oxidase [Alphaproteobacteria bacterium]|nr:iron oxidase [Alphaproteobacteria bacterium]MBV9554097.1 iron oxidase [Alphaproteobacteria bacterium]